MLGHAHPPPPSPHTHTTKTHTCEIPHFKQKERNNGWIKRIWHNSTCFLKNVKQNHSRLRGTRPCTTRHVVYTSCDIIISVCQHTMCTQGYTIICVCQHTLYTPGNSSICVLSHRLHLRWYHLCVNISCTHLVIAVFVCWHTVYTSGDIICVSIYHVHTWW